MKKVSIEEFLSEYEKELNKFFEDQDNGIESEAHIYGYDFKISWNGLEINVGDGATAYNHIIGAINDIKDEL